MICIISCGFKKLKSPNRACDLYVGPLFKASMRYARLRFPDHKIFILSAKYGLIPSTQIIAPYDQKIGVNETITVDIMIDQAQRLGILNQDVMLISGKSYSDFVKKVFKDVKITNPIHNLTLGYAIQLLTNGSKR
jgi:hypothetical protein